MATRYQKYDLDQFKCLEDHEDEIRAHIQEVLRKDGKIAITTKRSVDLDSYGTYVRPCCEDPMRGQSHGYFRMSDMFQLGPNSRFSRTKTKYGFKVLMKEPVHIVRKVVDYSLETKVIIKVAVDIISNAELCDPNSKPRFKFRLVVLDIKGNSKKRKNLVVDLEDGVFMWRGERLDADNNEKVAARVSKEIAGLSS